MVDIVDRLREGESADRTDPLLIEAAVEIERLRSDVFAHRERDAQIVPSRETKLPHIVTGSDGAAYPCSCPVLVDHPVLGISPEDYAAQLAARETVVPRRTTVADDYTPTIEEVRLYWASVTGWITDPKAAKIREARLVAFDRMLAAREREVREDQREIDAAAASAQLFAKGFLAHAFNVVGAIHAAPLRESDGLR